MVILAALTAWAGEARAACNGIQNVNAFAFEQVTVSNAAAGKGFTAAVFAPDGQFPAVMAVCGLETNPIRFRLDGLAPSATVGQLAVAGAQIEACGTLALRTFLAIRQGAADGVLSCHYYR
jgi:hypothetical protein